LSKVVDPELRRNLVELGMVREVRIEGGKVGLTLALTTLACPLKDQIVHDAKEAVRALEGVQEVEVHLVEMTPEEKQRMGLGAQQEKRGVAEHLNDIRRVVAVMSGKGGVGKSLVSALLGVGLRRRGERVGILDADITGPSVPKMFFPNGARPGQSPLGILPAETATGIKVMSINLLLPTEDQAVIWRGPLISGAIKQFWGDVFWGDLDWLVVDLPPGTSDASLTVMQSLPLSGVVMVTSPQDLAGMVVRKAAQMAQHLGVPILGLVENLSYYVCPDTGKRREVFGPSHAEETAKRLGVPLLGRLPIDPTIAQLCDVGAVEDYRSEAFDAIVEELAKRAPEARPSPLRPSERR
ncbi:MAG: Mrp/NBP35 family ATP-binding protein, partial [Anaerolineae bacterium]|nr:Mrp/NBP35 family ATP-binding protein [Anaerolineae bacterium]